MPFPSPTPETINIGHMLSSNAPPSNLERRDARVEVGWAGDVGVEGERLGGCAAERHALRPLPLRVHVLKRLLLTVRWESC